ncbi:MAG: outer membrane lipoprotein carrier protein LolA [Rickettsia endosymbiont of Ixodes persulcatus]|nr:outer membrane lipoprotein carrier protein LolA [Rickettsia endosymbiont of Ixodes persulcatus]MCZ6908424.1 outer membrane lipoprotein carrier protein LolA [Rickettsia endosymbiont of Ixodes persulcatus]MCZ6910030.1 outer membrane lipoprotein carrier protein LolA [Rickettsia endosymbiont of Ixodes persulcatus]MCZ6913453.1 outer membrane lipoprotein carrier protein LolA [Rickettsia endosymbiont of Ixodes persulcatus]MCZ6919270.1 outer membrane lipoprotein carrier protein LolA [Rickettsia endo
MKKILFLAVICFFANSITVYANDHTVILELKTYLRTIKSVAIDFTQEDSKDNIAKGKLLIRKPYNFRCNYYPPFPLVIIGTKNFVSMYDYDMEQVSRINRSENIFNFLLEDNKNIDKDFVFESVINEGNIFKIIIYHTLTEKRSEITFNKATKQIELLKIFEDNNIVTITFDKIAKVQKFSDDLFKLKNPEIFGPPERLTKSEIEKKYIVSSR